MENIRTLQREPHHTFAVARKHRALTVVALALLVANTLTCQELSGAQLDAPAAWPSDCEPLREACLGGDVEACNLLGTSFVLLGAARCSVEDVNPTLAAGFFRIACNGGSADGCVRLASLLSGEFGAIDEVLDSTSAATEAYRRAGMLLRRRCEDAQPDACRALVHQIDRGNLDGAIENEAQFLFSAVANIYGRDCDAGSVEACESLATLYSHFTPGAPDRRDGERRVRALVRACDLGSRVACSDAGESYSLGYPGIEIDRERALELFETGCDLDYHVACLQAGYLAASDSPVPQMEAALANYEKACHLFSCDGCRRAADIHERGLGVPKDLSRATTLLASPCEAN